MKNKCKTCYNLNQYIILKNKMGNQPNLPLGNIAKRPKKQQKKVCQTTVSVQPQIKQAIQPPPKVEAIIKKAEQGQFVNQKIIYDEALFRIEGQRLQKINYRSMVAITFMNKYKQSLAGSGVLITKNMVLTAAHNIYDKSYDQEYRDFRFYIGANGIAQQFYRAEKWEYPSQFKTCPNNLKRLKYDYALVKLKEIPEHPITYEQFLPIVLPCPVCLLQQKAETKLQIFGFPFYLDNYRNLDQQIGKKRILYQYGLAAKDRIVDVDHSKYKITYAISTLAGHSGCPVIVDGKIIAIHSGGGMNQDEQFNIGRLFTTQLINYIYIWNNDMGGGHQINIQIQSNTCNHPESIPSIQVGKEDEIIPDLDLSRHFNLQILHYWSKDKKISSIDLTHNYLLQELSLSGNNLSSIDLSNNVHLKELSLGWNQLTQIDLSNNVQLTQVYFYKNKLAKIDISKLKHLITLTLDYNDIQTIDLSNNSKLAHLHIQYNKLVEIDLSHNKKLYYAFLTKNQLTSINFQQNPQVNWIKCSKNKLTSIDLSKNKKLHQLQLDRNRLTSIVIWFPEKQQQAKYFASSFKNNLEYQDSEYCEVWILIRHEQFQVISDAKKQLWEYYNNNKYGNKKCNYMFITKIVE